MAVYVTLVNAVKISPTYNKIINAIGVAQLAFFASHDKCMRMAFHDRMIIILRILHLENKTFLWM